MKRVLLIGGAGQLGTAIRERWRECEIVAPSRAELDLADGPGLRAALERFAPQVFVNAAAFHDVDACEHEPDRAFAINAAAVGTAARHARDCGAVFVTISTDYVFDGEASAAYAEDCPPHPISVYGVSKLAGEYLVEALRMQAFVVRTCGVYGRTTLGRARASFIDRVLSQRGGEPPLRIVTDVVASPTFAGHLAEALAKLIETRAYGLYHAANVGPVSWYDFAREAVAQAGSGAAVEPILARERKTAAARPRFSALRNGKLESLGIAMPSWRDGISAYLGGTVR
ncbi:MAG TPA: dTDP-4-dehydrorhamnose reductase [Candidatus Babeliales bacterium]|nr:dTDP-4-dehydrorhamnose reductase [Candidatus Babeliales bacterium]